MDLIKFSNVDNGTGNRKLNFDLDPCLGPGLKFGSDLDYYLDPGFFITALISHIAGFQLLSRSALSDFFSHFTHYSNMGGEF